MSGHRSDRTSKNLPPLLRTRDSTIPCYHLCSRTTHIARLIKYSVLTRYPCTITCAAPSQPTHIRCETPRCIPLPLSCPSHHPGTLCKTLDRLLLLFSAFDNSMKLKSLYLLPVHLSTGFFKFIRLLTSTGQIVVNRARKTAQTAWFRLGSFAAQ